MCNTCGCKAAEETKYRSPSKKQLREEEAAIKDVDYMREKFQAMEVFPAGQHDMDESRRVLENMYSGIEIYDVIYMTKKSGRSNAFHIFMNTSRGGFNVYGRIGYGEPKIYGPMSDREYNAKISKKAKGGYRKETSFSAEGESYDYTPESYDPLTESPQIYNPMSESYSAEHGESYDYTPETYNPISESPQTYDPMSESYSAEGCGCGNSNCMCAENVLFIDQTGEETIMDEFIDEGEDYDDAKDYARKAMRNMSAEGRKRRYGKRQRFDHIKGNSRYLARDAKGRWISNVGVSGSIKQDLRSNAKSQQPSGFRGLGDAKHAEGMILTDAMVQWEDGFGTSSPSAPPVGIHFGAEAYTDMYPQNSAEIDGMTGNGVPVAYGSGSSQYVEPPVRMGAEEKGTLMTFGEISYEYDYDELDGMDNSDVVGIMKAVENFIGDSGSGEGEDEFTYETEDDDQIQVYLSWKHSYEGINSAEDQSGFTYAQEDFIPNSYGEDSALTSGRGVPQWYGSAEQGYNDRDDESIGMRHRGTHSQSMKDRRDESKGMTDSMNHHHPYSDVSTMMAEGWEHFEAMEVFPPSYDGDLSNSMSRIKEKYPRAGLKSGTRPIYLTKRQGSMNRFHFFIETSVGNFNVYGRIGYPNPQVYGPMTSGIYADKMRTKIRKGYKKSAETFENPMIDQGYYPNTYGESSAVISGNGVPQWYGSAETKERLNYKPIVIEKPIETGAKLGLGFILMSAGVTIASVFTGMLLGE